MITDTGEDGKEASSDVLTTNQRQEALSRAYIQAIAGRAGMSVSVPTPDIGIDISVHDIIVVNKRHMESGFRIDFQAKSTTLAHLDVTSLRYDLAADAYELLRYPAGAPRLLVVLVLPENEAEWVGLTEAELILRRACYWVSLRGRGATKNRKSVRITIPRTNLLTPEALQLLMAAIKTGELP